MDVMFYIICHHGHFKKIMTMMQKVIPLGSKMLAIEQPYTVTFIIDLKKSMLILFGKPKDLNYGIKLP